MKKTFGTDIKIILVGNPNTGKTCFVNKWTKNQFTDKYRATIMSEFGYKIVDYNETIYRIQLWDIAGQDKTTCITKFFCKDSHGAIIASDITNKKSLHEVLKWKTSIEENARFPDNTDLPILLIENKADLVEDNESDDIVSKEFARKYNFIGAFKTSAKTGLNINESIHYLLLQIISKLENCNNMPNDNLKDKSFVIEKAKILSNQKGGSNCC